MSRKPLTKTDFTLMNTIFSSLAASTRTEIAPVVNKEGAPAFLRSLQEQVLQVLTTGTLQDTFYASREQHAKEAVEVLTEARVKCPHFLARALVWAREQGLMKSLPVLGLAILSAGGGRTRDLFESTFRRVIKTPDDLRSFVEIAISGVLTGRKGLGGMTVDAVSEYLNSMSEYHTLKYGSSVSKGVTLRDAIRMSHPKPQTPSVSERFGWLVGGAKRLGQDLNANPQIRTFEALKRATSENEVITLIRQGRLPFEVVVPALKASTPGIWSELLHQAPYMNLLRNLVTFTRHGVFKDEANVAVAVAKLTNPQAVEHSKVLPFRFFDAYTKYVEGEHDERIADALREALDISFVNMPSLGDRTIAIGPDVSGSMQNVVSQKGTARYIDIAGIFTGALMKRIEKRAIPLPFDTRVHHNHTLSSRDDVMTTTQKIAAYGGGGTAVGSPIEHLLHRKVVVDAFVGITDNVDWAYGDGYNCSGSFLDLWRRYKSEVAPNAQALSLIHI